MNRIFKRPEVLAE